MLKSNDPLYRRIRSHASKKIKYTPKTPKNERLAGYKQFLKLERQMIVRHHRKGDSGLRVTGCGAIMVDVVLESIVRTALLTFSEKHGVLPCQFSLLGLGGYGRGELNPLSDIDIMFLFPDKVKTSMVEDMKAVLTDEVLYPMWDLGFKVGHSTRSVKECIEESQADIKTRNSLLESRRILGSATVHGEFKKTYREFLDKIDILPYLEEMIQVQDERRNQYGGTVFASEPNIKNGVGGLREYQGAQWLLRLIYGKPKFSQLYKYDNIYSRDMRDFEAAYDFFLRIRNELHFNSRRPTDELTLVMQTVVAEKLGYTGTSLEQVEGLMQDYYFHARNSLRVAKSLEKRALATYATQRTKRRQRFRLSFRKPSIVETEGFLIENDRISLKQSDSFSIEPERIIRAFRLMQVMNLKMSFEMRASVEANVHSITQASLQETNEMNDLLKMLTNVGNVAPVLEDIYNTGLLKRIIPEFQTLSCLVQHDDFLVRYAEDQKVLKSVHYLDQIVSGKDSKVMTQLPVLDSDTKIEDLYLALLVRSLDQENTYKPQVSDCGVDLPENVNLREILGRFQLDPTRINRIVSFIEKHNKVARFWQRVETEDRRLIQKIAQTLQDHETAALSFWFHYCDSLGRNPQYWWVHSLGDASEIHRAVVEQIESGLLQNSDNLDPSSDPKEMTRLEIKDQSIPDVCDDEIDAHFKLLPNRYFESRSADDVELHIQLVHQLLETIQQAESLQMLKPIIDWKDDSGGGFSVINVVTWDRAGLFYKLAGAISSAGLNILKARAISRSDHIAIDTFYVSHGKTGKVDCNLVKENFERSIESILIDGEKARGMVREQYEKDKSKRSVLSSSSKFDLGLPVQVELYYDQELKQVVADYQGKDRIGLLYQVSRTLSSEHLNIDSVRISTSNDIATGTLFLTDESKKQRNETKRFAEIREKLIAILGSESWLLH